jgi:hypothetical protein
MRAEIVGSLSREGGGTQHPTPGGGFGFTRGALAEVAGPEVPLTAAGTDGGAAR